MQYHVVKLSICACLATIGGCGTLAAQQAPVNAQLQFEVASVKPTQLEGGPGRAMAMARMLEMMPLGMIPMPDAGRVRIQGWSLRQVVAAAYRVRGDKITGPGWMADEYYDIEAKMPQGAKRDEAHEMLQALLAERFGLQLHREPHEVSGFALVVGKHGPKLEEFVPPAPQLEPASPEEAEERQKQRLKTMQATMAERMKTAKATPGVSRNSWGGVTLADLAERLAPLAGGPVVDETGISGKYKVEVETWRATEDTAEQTIFGAVEKLGLRLAPKKVTVEYLIIDKVSKAPTAN
jgi:uncharacterized protein (TIGR03435 family)